VVSQLEEFEPMRACACLVQLAAAADGQFDILAVEVWSVGGKPRS
jgi:hypothetical protein